MNGNDFLKIHGHELNPYIRMRVRLCKIFKYIEIVCRQTHDISANAYMDSV